MNDSITNIIDNQFIGYVKLLQHVNFGIDTLSTVIVIGITMFKTPKTMNAYKYFLLNITFWSYLVDLNLTIVYIPLSMFPAPGFCTLGIAGDLPGLLLPSGLPFSLLILLLGACSASIVCALYYRYRLLTNKSMKIFSKKIFIFGMFLFHFLNGGIIFLLFIIAALLSKVEINSWWDYIKENYPYEFPLAIKLYPACGGLLLEDFNFKVVFYVILLEFGVYFLVAIIGPWYINKCLKERVNNFTKKVHDLHKQLIVALFFQSLIPLICLLLPYVLMICSLFLHMVNTIHLTAVLFQISSLHSFFNALAIIMLVKPYRQSLFKYFQNTSVQDAIQVQPV